MSKSDIRNGVLSGISYESGEESYLEYDEDAVKTLSRLRIKIKSLNPYELMDTLGFNEEQRNWALLLYRSMIDDQTIDISDLDYINSTGINFGDIVFSDGAVNVVYYNQGDIRWGSEPYGKTGIIATSACGSTALAMVISSLTHNTVTPQVMAD